MLQHVGAVLGAVTEVGGHVVQHRLFGQVEACLLYTSDAADERSSVDLGGRRIIKKKKHQSTTSTPRDTQC